MNLDCARRGFSDASKSCRKTYPDCSVKDVPARLGRLGVTKITKKVKGVKGFNPIGPYKSMI